MSNPDRFIVFTGGPGSGKSSVIDALAAAGAQTMPEAGRAIIQAQVAIGGNALPWANRALYAEQMLLWELRSHKEAQKLAGPIFFDRGVADVAGYLRLCGLHVPPHMIRASELYRYSNRVFLFPTWPEIFTKDAERKQSLEEAQATCLAVSKAWREAGYTTLEVPKTGVADRVSFILDNIPGS